MQPLRWEGRAATSGLGAKPRVLQPGEGSHRLGAQAHQAHPPHLPQLPTQLPRLSPLRASLLPEAPPNTWYQVRVAQSCRSGLPWGHIGPTLWGTSQSYLCPQPM